MNRPRTLSPGLTVHDAVRQIPGALDIFRRLGIDACCGGDLSLDAAADRHGVDRELLRAALETAAARQASDDP